MFGDPGGYFHIRRSGGGGGGAWTLHRVKRQNLGQGSVKFTNNRKNLGSSVTTRCKNWERITSLGHLGLYLKFKGQNLGLRHEFQRQNLGPSPPTSLYGSTPSEFGESFSRALEIA